MGKIQWSVPQVSKLWKTLCTLYEVADTRARIAECSKSTMKHGIQPMMVSLCFFSSDGVFGAALRSDQSVLFDLPV